MSLFSKQLYVPVQEYYNAETEEIDDQVFESLGDSYLTDIAMECNAGVTRTISALAITHVMESVGVVTEGTMDSLKSARDKVINLFKDAWKKIRGWFDKAIYNIKVQFTSADKFYSKYKKDITDKMSKYGSVKVSKFRTYKTQKVIYLANSIKTLPSEVGTIVGLREKGVVDRDDKAEKEKYGETSQADFVAAIIKAQFREFYNNPPTTISELKSAIVKDLYEENTDIEVSTDKMKTLMDFMANYKANITSIEKARKDTDTFYNTAIRTIMGVDSKATLQINSNAYNAGISIINGVVPVIVKFYKDTNMYAVNFFKMYLKKPATKVPEKDKTKRSVPTNESMDIFESIFNDI